MVKNKFALIPKHNPTPLPVYKMDWVAFFAPVILFIQNVPLLEFFIIPLILLFSKKRKRPDRLYHFIESKSVFLKVLNKRSVLSLAGGKLHTTSEMNPSLGRKVKDSERDFYVLVIENPRDISMFEPIVYGCRYFHAYKWWKHLRREYTFSELKDINFKLRGDVYYEEYKVIKNINRRFLVAYIHSLTPQDNTRLIQKAQKALFYFGEILLSVLTFYITTIFSYIYIFCYFTNKEMPLDFLSPFLPKSCIDFAYLATTVLAGLLAFVFFLHRYLRSGVIKSRE